MRWYGVRHRYGFDAKTAEKEKTGAYQSKVCHKRVKDEKDTRDFWIWEGEDHNR